MPDERRVGLVKNVKGLRNTHWYLQNSHGDIKHSIGKTVNKIVITIYGALPLKSAPPPPDCILRNRDSYDPQTLKRKVTQVWPQYKLADGETWPQREVLTIIPSCN